MGKSRYKKRKNVPQVLWRKYGNKPHTLSHTITSLIPKSSSECCRCNGRRCISCCGKRYLVTSDDPSEYKQLLNKCFVVVSKNAPPLHFSPHSHWPQHQIVWRTIEMIMSNQHRVEDQNVLCYDYDKYKHSSTIISLLTTSTWIRLSERVGDAFMFHLLMWTSIFLPLPGKEYQQVTGFPMSELVFKVTRHKHTLQGSSKKRKRIDILTRSVKSKQNDILSCFTCFGCAGKSNSISSSCPRNEYCMNTSLNGDETEASVAYANIEGTARPTINMRNKRKQLKPTKWQRQKSRRILPSEEAYNVCQEVKSPSNKGNCRKRSREYRWKRHQKRRLPSSQEACNLSQCAQLSKDGILLTDHRKFPCSCCSVFQTMQKGSGSQIDRRSMFYKLGSAFSVFPKDHILNSLKPNIYDANILFKNIFGLSDANINFPSMGCFHKNHSCITGSTCLYHSILKHLKDLIRKAHVCKHAKFLEKHCRVPYFDLKFPEDQSSRVVGHRFMMNDSAILKASAKLAEDMSSDKFIFLDPNLPIKDSRNTAVHYDPNKSYCTKEQVTSYIWAVCRSIIPSNLLGTPKAQRTLCKNICKFIKLRRFEKSFLKQGMHKLKLSNFTFLLNPHALCYSSRYLEGQKVKTKGCYNTDNATYMLKQRILQSWMLWFFSSFVLPLVRANFYVTESQHGKQDIFYYHHSVWKEIVNRNMACVKDQRYKLLDNASVLKMIWHRSFGFSKVRFLPKSTGVRPLANLKASSRISMSLPSKSVVSKTFTSVNGVLRDLHTVLKVTCLKRPERLGSSVFGYNDVYRKLCSFLSVVKRGPGSMPELYVVAADVSKAYDSVNQDKLLSVMENFMSSDNYLLKKYHRVVCTKKSLQVREHMTAEHQNLNTRLTKSMSAISGHSNSVIVAKEWTKYKKKQDLFSILYEHVKQNVLQINRNFYLQSVGIPQGSIVSPLLCSIYYGHMENNILLPYIRKICDSEKVHSSEERDGSDAFSGKDSLSLSPRYLILRFIDDFLFVSTSKKLALGFFMRLRRGFPAYNCDMNKEKFGLSFDVGHILKIQPSRSCVHENGASYVCWSGLLINCCTLEVQADYTRYLESHLSTTLTVRWQDKAGQILKTKLCDYLRPKCHPIFFDSNINSAAVVRLNIYQAFVICAMKFHCYVADISIFCHLEPESCMEDICSSLRYMNKLIRKRMNSIHLDSNLHPVLELKKGEVKWLGLNAFIKVLKRKETRYRELLSLLKNKLQKSDKPDIVSSAMKYAIDDSHSSVVWKIKY